MESLGIAPIYIVLFIVPALAGLGVLVYKGWEREKRRRIERLRQLAEEEADRKIHETARIPEWGAFICHDGVPRNAEQHLPGSLLLLGVGTYGVKQLLRFLIELARLHLDDLVGAVLAVEADKILRDDFLMQLPAVYRDRIVLGKADQYSGGFSNRDVSYVKQHIANWGPEIEQAATEAAQLFLRRNHASVPSEIVTFAGLGGHWYVGVVAVNTLHKSFPEVQITACTDLPRDEPLRDQYLEGRSYYEQAGVHGWLISDSLARDSVSNDSAMAQLLSGFCVAALQADSSPRLDNIFTRVLGTQPGGVCSIQYVYHDMVAYTFKPCVCRDARYYVSIQQLIHDTLSLLDTIETGQGMAALDMPMGQERLSTYDLMLVPLQLEDLLAVTDHVAKARSLALEHQDPKQPRLTLWGRENYHTLLSSWPSDVNPAEPFAKLAAFRLRSLTHTPTTLPELVKVPHKRALPAPRTRRVPVTLAATNGKEELASRDV